MAEGKGNGNGKGIGPAVVSDPLLSILINSITHQVQRIIARDQRQVSGLESWKHERNKEIILMGDPFEKEHLWLLEEFRKCFG